MIISLQMKSNDIFPFSKQTQEPMLEKCSTLRCLPKTKMASALLPSLSTFDLVIIFSSTALYLAVCWYNTCNVKVETVNVILGIYYLTSRYLFSLWRITKRHTSVASSNFLSRFPGFCWQGRGLSVEYSHKRHPPPALSFPSFWPWRK